MASRHAMAQLCRYIGIKAVGCNNINVHGKTAVRADGKYYIYTTGFNEPRPRSYMVSETTYDYLEEHEDELGIWAVWLNQADRMMLRKIREMRTAE